MHERAMRRGDGAIGAFALVLLGACSGAGEDPADGAGAIDRVPAVTGSDPAVATPEPPASDDGAVAPDEGAVAVTGSTGPVNGFVVVARTDGDSDGGYEVEGVWRYDTEADTVVGEIRRVPDGELLSSTRYDYGPDGLPVRERSFGQDGTLLGTMLLDYDDGRLVTTSRTGSATTAVTTTVYGYDDAGRLSSSTRTREEGDGFSITWHSRWLRDDGGRLVALEESLDPLFEPLTLRRDFELDTSGNVIAYTEDGVTQYAVERDADGNVVRTIEFDPEGEPFSVTDYAYEPMPEPVFNLLNVELSLAPPFGP